LGFKRWTLFLSFALLVIDVIGRLLMVITRMFPTNTIMQIFGIVGGTIIAFVFVIIVFIKNKN